MFLQLFEGIDDKKIKPQDVKDKDQLPSVDDRSLKTEFDYLKKLWKILHPTEEEIDSFITSNKAKISVQTPTLRKYEQSVLQDIASLRNTNRLEDPGMEFHLENETSNSDS